MLGVRDWVPDGCQTTGIFMSSLSICHKTRPFMQLNSHSRHEITARFQSLYYLVPEIMD